MKLTDAPTSVAEADDPGQPKYATLARRPSMRVIGTGPAAAKALESTRRAQAASSSQVSARIRW
jgi:hypothetical protein